MVAGEVCCGFFHELKLHLQFPGLPLELTQSRALTHGQRRFLAGVLTAVYANPVSEGAFVDTELLRHSGDRARGLDHHLHGFVLEFRREALLRSGQLLHLSRLSILMDGLSGRLGAPHTEATDLETLLRCVLPLVRSSSSVVVVDAVRPAMMSR